MASGAAQDAAGCVLRGLTALYLNFFQATVRPSCGVAGIEKAAPPLPVATGKGGAAFSMPATPQEGRTVA